MTRRRRQNRRPARRPHRRGSPFINFSVRDTQNGWPDPAPVTRLMGTSLTVDVASHDQEAAARIETIEKARRWNSLLAIFPLNLLARIFGFRPWRY
jgi:hypothetical protein